MWFFRYQVWAGFIVLCWPIIIIKYLESEWGSTYGVVLCVQIIVYDRIFYNRVFPQKQDTANRKPYPTPDIPSKYDKTLLYPYNIIHASLSLFCYRIFVTHVEPTELIYIYTTHHLIWANDILKVYIQYFRKRCYYCFGDFLQTF